MIRTIGALAFQQDVGELLGSVRGRKDSIVIEEDGKPVAALIDAALFARICRQQERFDELAARLAADFAGSPQDEGLAQIDRTASIVRTARKACRR